MARLTCSRSGWGTVQDPVTGERIPVDADDLEVAQAERLADEYGPISYVESDPNPTCGVNGCTRTVDDPEDVCWQHSED